MKLQAFILFLIVLFTPQIGSADSGEIALKINAFARIADKYSNNPDGADLPLSEIRNSISVIADADDVWRLGLISKLICEGHDSSDKEACRIWDAVFWACAERLIELRVSKEHFNSFCRRANVQGLPKKKLEQMARTLRDERHLK